MGAPAFICRPIDLKTLLFRPSFLLLCHLLVRSFVLLVRSFVNSVLLQRPTTRAKCSASSATSASHPRTGGITSRTFCLAAQTTRSCALWRAPPRSCYSLQPCSEAVPHSSKRSASTFSTAMLCTHRCAAFRSIRSSAYSLFSATPVLVRASGLRCLLLYSLFSATSRCAHGGIGKGLGKVLMKLSLWVPLRAFAM